MVVSAVIGLVTGAVAVAVLHWIPPSFGFWGDLRLLALGLIVAVPMIERRFDRAIFGAVTSAARMALATIGAVACYLGALRADIALGGTAIAGGLWALPLAWIIAALVAELIGYFAGALD